MIQPSSSLADVAFAVCTALDKAGVTAVLTGGSAATFYAPQAYQSDDLDFVIALQGDGDGASALTELGYQQTRGFYKHPQSPFPLEFPRGPLGIGDDIITDWATYRCDNELLYVLTPTDCCRDRLAAFLFWDDFAGLAQAVSVALAQRDLVSLDLVQAWCKRERAEEKFQMFKRQLVGKA